MRTFVLVTTAITISLGMGLSIEHFLDEEHYNPGFYEFPWIISLHVALGGSYLGLAVFQLAPRIRQTRPTLHHTVGRLAVALGLVSAATAIATTILFPFSGPAMIIFVAPFAGYFGFALLNGYRFARRHNFAQHRNWMIRALAIASAIATQRLILVPALLAMGDDPVTIRWVSMFSFTSAFALHALVSELWIRITAIGEVRPAEVTPANPLQRT